jgi:galactokinase
MTDNPTRLLNATFALDDNPDNIGYAERDGQPFIVLGNIDLALGLSTQAALDKLATVTATAAANQRARNLKAVS